MVIGVDVSRANCRERTGVEWYTFWLIQAFKSVAANESIVLYSPTPPLSDWGEFPCAWRWKTLSFPFTRGWSTLRLSAEMLLYPPDVLFLPSSGIPPILPGNTVATVHDAAFIQHPTVYSATERMVQRSNLRQALSRTNTIIAPSAATKRLLLEIDPTMKKKIVVIAHGAPPFVARQSPIKTAHSLLFVGRIETKKNLVSLITAVEHLAHQPEFNKLHLTLVGKPGNGFQKIQPLLQQCSRHIQWLGWLPNEELQRYRAQAQMVMLPSVAEGFGFPILESWQWGSVPMVTSIDALNEVGRDATIRIEGTDAQSIERAIAGALRDPNRCNELVQKGQQYLKEYQWSRCAQQTLAILNGTHHYE